MNLLATPTKALLLALVLAGCGGAGTESPTGPSMSLTANPTSVASGGSSTLTWNSTNATSCSATGAWSGTKGPSGSQSTGPLNTSSTFSLSCGGPNGTASVSVQV